MPIPRPTPMQSKQAFLSSCMADATMVSEYPEEPQRYAVCLSAWDGDRGYSYDYYDVLEKELK